LGTHIFSICICEDIDWDFFALEISVRYGTVGKGFGKGTGGREIWEGCGYIFIEGGFDVEGPEESTDGGI